MGPSVRLCPFCSLWIVLHLEVAMALRATEAKDLTIIADKHDSMTWIDVTGAVPTFLNPHRWQTVALMTI
jgi:hypothetical protein